MKIAKLTALALMAGLLTAPAFAAKMDFSATMSAKSEVPPTASSGTGDMLASYDTATKMLTYTVTYSGLTGAATAAHIHGPAAPGANAPVLIPFANPVSPISGTATLTDAQAADLMAGKLYVNVHTAENKGGEIRGQIMKAKN